MDNYGWTGALQQPKDAVPIANVNFIMFIPRDVAAQPVKCPRSITFWPQQHGTLVIVDTKYRKSSLVEMKGTSDLISPQGPSH